MPMETSGLLKKKSRWTKSQISKWKLFNEIDVILKLIPDIEWLIVNYSFNKYPYREILEKLWANKKIPNVVSEYGCFPKCRHGFYCWYCSTNERHEKEQRIVEYKLVTREIRNIIHQERRTKLINNKYLKKKYLPIKNEYKTLIYICAHTDLIDV